MQTYALKDGLASYLRLGPSRVCVGVGGGGGGWGGGQCSLSPSENNVQITPAPLKGYCTVFHFFQKYS